MTEGMNMNMNYSVSLRIKVDGNRWMTVGKDHVIPWNVKDLIMASSSWTVINDDTANEAESLIANLQRGILELTNSPDQYIHYEVEHGIGTRRDVLEFYKGLLKDCKEYPYARIYGHVVS